MGWGEAEMICVLLVFKPLLHVAALSWLSMVLLTLYTLAICFLTMQAIQMFVMMIVVIGRRIDKTSIGCSKRQ